MKNAQPIDLIGGGRAAEKVSSGADPHFDLPQADRIEFKIEAYRGEYFLDAHFPDPLLAGRTTMKNLGVFNTYDAALSAQSSARLAWQDRLEQMAEDAQDDLLALDQPGG